MFSQPKYTLPECRRVVMSMAKKPPSVSRSMYEYLKTNSKNMRRLREIEGKIRELAGKTREIAGKSREIPGNRGRYREIAGAKKKKNGD